MKRIIIIIVTLILCSVTLTAENKAEKEAPAKEGLKDFQKVSYALGMDTGFSLKRLETDIDIVLFLQGVEDSFKGKKLLISEEQSAAIKSDFFKKMQEERMRKMNELGGKNQKEGEVFLSENKKKEGVITTSSGLQYVVLRKGEGPIPKDTDRVKVQYRGTLIDGTEFDSSYKRGQPATFPVKGVIAGWTEALQLMNVGSKWRLFIPSNLAYGERGGGPMIGPNAVLIFDIELLAIES